MDTESFNNACNGKSASADGLNLPEFKREASQLYPEHKSEINAMSRKQLEDFCKQQQRVQFPARSPRLQSSSQSIVLPSLSRQIRLLSSVQSTSPSVRSTSPSVRRRSAQSSEKSKRSNKKVMEELETAIFDGDFRAVDIILNEHNLNLNKIDSRGWTPLLMATIKGHINIVDMLLRHGANVDLQDLYGNIPLFVASRHGNDGIVNLLIQQGANLDIKDRYHDTALHVACKYQYHNIVKILIDHGIDINSKNIDGNTALHVAVTNRDRDSVRILLEAGAHILPNNDGYTPLDFAKMDNNSDIIKIFQDYESDIKEPDRD
jgi:ankyrin repeat protein